MTRRGLGARRGFRSALSKLLMQAFILTDELLLVIILIIYSFIILHSRPRPLLPGYLLPPTTTLLQPRTSNTVESILVTGCSLLERHRRHGRGAAATGGRVLGDCQECRSRERRRALLPQRLHRGSSDRAAVLLQRRAGHLRLQVPQESWRSSDQHRGHRRGRLTRF